MVASLLDAELIFLIESKGRAVRCASIAFQSQSYIVSRHISDSKPGKKRTEPVRITKRNAADAADRFLEG